MPEDDRLRHHRDIERVRQAAAGAVETDPDGLAQLVPVFEACAGSRTPCFLLHELPPQAVERALTECRRILRPGGRLVITEPSRVQWQTGAWRLLWRHGWRGPYFRVLARLLYEPFLAAFHRSNLVDLLERCGFAEIREENEFPTTRWTSVRN